MVLDKKSKKILTVIFIIALLTLFVIAVYLDSIFSSKRSKYFYDHKVVGRIESISIKGSIFIRLKNDDKSYQFYQPEVSREKKDFFKSVHVGDSIFKNAFVDTILVKSNGQYYKYYFEQ